MSTGFNVNDYWLARGRTYMEETRTPAEFHRLQERFLLDVLRESGLPLRRFLEIGCGFGRITRLLSEAWPEADLTAVDLSPEQLANARRHCGERARVTFQRYDFYSGDPLPGRGFDVVLAIEVFLHHPPEFLRGFLPRLLEAGRNLVHIDWSESWAGPLPEHVWVHDYAALHAQGGFECATFVLPAKVDGKQQKLFVAGRSLPPSVRTLERILATQPGSADPAAVPAPPEDDWTRRLRAATEDLLRVIPAGRTLILVDDGQWGRVRALAGHRVLPFLEKDGTYWGPPADDATAWRELRRMREAGATDLVVAWPSFWWLRHYAEFHRRLRGTFPCVLDNDNVVVFRLQP